jgi:hypothetical protein
MEPEWAARIERIGGHKLNTVVRDGIPIVGCFESRSIAWSTTSICFPVDSQINAAATFDAGWAGPYNRMSHVDSPDETAHDGSVVCDFGRRARRFFLHVTYYQQTGGLHEQVATAPLGGSKQQWPQPTNRKASRSP